MIDLNHPPAEPEPAGPQERRDPPQPSSGRGLSVSFIASAGVLAINISTGVLLARALGPSQRGLLAAVLLWPTILGNIGVLGLLEAATYHVARGTSPAGTVLGSGLVLVLLQALLFTLLCAGLIPLVFAQRGAHALTDAYVFLPYIPLNIATLFLAGVLNGRQRYASVQALRVTVVLLTAVLLFGLLVAGSLTLLHAVVSYLLAATGTLLLGIWLLIRSEPLALHFSRQLIRQLFAFGIRSHASNVSSQFNQRLDQLVISAFLAPFKLGLYVIAVTLTSLASLVGESVTWIALPVIAALEPGEERTRTACRFVSLTLLVSALSSLPILIFISPLIDLFFGHAYHGAANVSRLLLVGVVLFATNRAFEAVLRGVGRPLDAGVAELIALGATCGGLAALLPLLGLLGAAITSALAYGVSSMWMASRVAAALGVPTRSLYAPARGELRWMLKTVQAQLRR